MPVFQHHASWVVSFGFAGRQHRFTVGSQGTWMEVEPVLAAADRFLAGIGRPDRVFQFRHSRGENGEWGMFVTMPAPTFTAVAARLELPLAPRG
jgi:hypothetical protein